MSGEHLPGGRCSYFLIIKNSKNTCALDQLCNLTKKMEGGDKTSFFEFTSVWKLSTGLGMKNQLKPTYTRSYALYPQVWDWKKAILVIENRNVRFVHFS